MIRDRLAPPAAEECLIQSREGKYKGGTLIAEWVGDLETHLALVADPDGYRPEACARCLFATLHAHCYPERHLLGEEAGEAGSTVVRIVQYICAHPACGATWRIVPRFLARHLWRAWTTVERVVAPQDARRPRDAPTIPTRTQQRWRGRFVSAALVVVVLLATSGSAVLETISQSVGLDATRAELVEEHARTADAAPGMRLATLAALVHRLERGIRLV